ncbi:MAG TPA: hypothetical protein VGM30_04485 [Puia sp.]|jgi:hypothetical protein
MRKKAGDIRSERVQVLYTHQEIDKLKKLYSKSTCPSLGSYVRKVSLREPVEITRRNLSFDDFVQEIVVLRKELSFVRKLTYTFEREAQLIRLQEEIRTVIYKISDLCMQI